MIINNTYPCDPDSNNSFVHPISLIKIKEPLINLWQEIIQTIFKQITPNHIFYKYKNSLSEMNH